MIEAIAADIAISLGGNRVVFRIEARISRKAELSSCPTTLISHHLKDAHGGHEIAVR